MRQRGRSEKRNYQSKCFHSFYYVIDHPGIHFFFHINSLNCFGWFLLYYLLHLLRSDCFKALTSLQPQFHLNIWIFKYLPWKGVFRKCLINKSKNRQSQGVHFLSICSHKFWKFICLVPSMMLPSWVWCVCQSAQKNSGYITDQYNLVLHRYWLHQRTTPILIYLLIIPLNGTLVSSIAIKST